MALDVLDSVASVPPQRGAQRLSPEPSADDLAVVRRDLRIRLLRDLVSNGLYRVSTEALAERLIGVVGPRA